MILQNVDRNIGPASYKFAGKDQLLVTKIFFTHQGEGPFAGRPAFFVRLAGCNRGDKTSMGCAFCDTDFKFDQGRITNFREIGWEFQRYLEQYPLLREKPIVVLTGGEPMMQDNISYFIEYLLNELRCPAIQIESNGDRLADNFPWDSKVKLVVSPKTNRAGYGPIKDEVLLRIDSLKFLISADVASPYHRLPDWISGSDIPGPIYLSPITEYLREVGDGEVASIWRPGLIDPVATANNYRYAANMAKLGGYRLSMQTHLWFEVE